MPNHTSNNLIVSGPDTDAFFAVVTSGPDDNFVKTLVPMPDAIADLSTGSAMVDGEKVEVWRDGTDGQRHKVPELELQHITDLYGTYDWYKWTQTHWGTKWGAYDVDYAIGEGNGSIVFDSAWAPPLTAVETISKMFPRNVFKLAYAEGGSCFYGYAILQDGTVIDQFESGDFWDNMVDADDVDDDLLNALMPACREFIETYGLHTGG